VAVSFDPAVRLTAEPTGVPVEVHALEPEGWVVSGPHTKNETVPVGLPLVALPATTALSELLWPRVMLLCAGVVVVVVVVVVPVDVTGVDEQAMPPLGTLAETCNGAIEMLANVVNGSHVPGPPTCKVNRDAEAEAWVPSCANDSLVTDPMESIPRPKGRSSDGWAAFTDPTLSPQRFVTESTGALKETVAPPDSPVATAVRVGADTTPIVSWNKVPLNKVTLVSCDEAVEVTPSFEDPVTAVSSTSDWLETVGFSEMSELTPGKKLLTADA